MILLKLNIVILVEVFHAPFGNLHRLDNGHRRFFIHRQALFELQLSLKLDDFLDIKWHVRLETFAYLFGWLVFVEVESGERLNLMLKFNVELKAGASDTTGCKFNIAAELLD